MEEVLRRFEEFFETQEVSGCKAFQKTVLNKKSRSSMAPFLYYALNSKDDFCNDCHPK